MSVNGNPAGNNNRVETSSISSDNYQTVGGWLLLLCIGLTITFPLYLLYKIISSNSDLADLDGAFPSLNAIVYVENSLNLILMAFSIYAGYSLWARRPNAVFKAKAFLLSIVAFAVIDLLIVFIVDIPSLFSKAVRNQTFIGVAQAVMYAGVWFAYLWQSKRVKATYSKS